MSVQQHKELIQRFVDEPWNRGNFAIFADVRDPAYVLHPHGNRATLEDAIALYRAAFPDLHLTIEELIGEGDNVA